MAKLYVSLTPEEVRASIPYDLICMVRYGCTWNTGRRRRAWQLDFTEDEKKAAGRLFRQSFEWTCGRGFVLHHPYDHEHVQPVAQARRVLRIHLKWR